MSKAANEKEKGRLSKMYGHFVQVPYVWYGLCRKYEIPKEIATLKTRGNTIDLNPMEINVLAYLANYTECYPSNKQIAEIFQVGTSTIEKYLKELRWVGFIKTFESKNVPNHTDRRNIYIQFDVINDVLASESNPYKCMVHSNGKSTNPYECMDHTIQTNGISHTDVWDNPYKLATNKKVLESIRKNNKEMAPPKMNHSDSASNKKMFAKLSNREKELMRNNYERFFDISRAASDFDVTEEVVAMVLTEHQNAQQNKVEEFLPFN